MSTTTRKNPRGILNRLAAMSKLSEKEIAVGYPRGKAEAYPDGTPVAEVAAKNCYGIGVPERNFMGLADELIKSDSTISSCMTEIVKHSNEPIVVAALAEAAGQRGAALVKQAITEGDWVPNSPVTIERKSKGHGGETRPLIDTSHMRNSATYVVRDKTT